MKDLSEHARQMRQRVYQHLLRTRGWKYRIFLRYLRFFKYISFAPLRGEFLESYYTLMRYLDDIVDGDATLPDGYNNSIDYITDKIKFAANPAYPADEADFLLLYCFTIAKKFNQEFNAETDDILNSLLFDARRKGRLIIFPAEDLKKHFHCMDIRGTIKATLKIFKEDPDKYHLLEPLGTASRYQFDLEDFETDIKAGYVNICAEDCLQFGIGPEELRNTDTDAVRSWKCHHAQEGLALLEKHHLLLPQGKFSLLARSVFPTVYEWPAKKVFRGILSKNKQGVEKMVYGFSK